MPFFWAHGTWLRFVVRSLLTALLGFHLKSHTQKENKNVVSLRFHLLLVSE